MEVICFEDKAFFEMLDRIYARYKSESNVQEKWISREDAMRRLGITSLTTLQSYRDQGKIRYTQPTPKVILYDAESIYAFLEDNACNTF